MATIKEEIGCICPYGDRCRALARLFTEKCERDVAVVRGGYIQIPPAGTDHLIFATSFHFPSTNNGVKESSNDIIINKPELTSWQQIKRAYMSYFHILAKEEADNDGDDSVVAQSISTFDEGAYHNKDSPEHLSTNSQGDLHVAMHHFHPKIIMPMKTRQQEWDDSPVWQCLYYSSMIALLEGQDLDHIKRIANQSNRIKLI